MKLNKYIKTVLFMLIAGAPIFSLFACSTVSKVMLPYKERFECRRSADYGYCGPVSKVYKESVITSKKGGVQW